MNHRQVLQRIIENGGSCKNIACSECTIHCALDWKNVPEAIRNSEYGVPTEVFKKYAEDLLSRMGEEVNQEVRG